MKSKLATQSGNIKSIAKKTSTGKRVKSSPPLPGEPIEKKTGSFPENSLPIERHDPLYSGCVHFSNKANEKQKEYVKKLIEDRMLREHIEFKHLVYSLAEMFDYDPLHALWASSSISSLLKVLYKNQSVLSGMVSHERERVVKTLENLSGFLDALNHFDEYKALFDLAKIENKAGILVLDVVDMQRRHVERKIVNDGVFVFDLAFDIPFNKLSEKAKVERLNIYLEEHKAWTDDEFVLPDHVKHYLPKAERMLKAEQQKGSV